MKTTLMLVFIFLSLSSYAGTRLEIIKLGNPTLRDVALEIRPEEIQSKEVQTLIDDMITTMKSAGGVGLAAPQVNKSLRMFVMKSWPTVALTVVINPTVEYIEADGTKSSTEGCLSIPGRTMTVERYKKIRMSYFNRKGEWISEEISGFKAIISQHEYDHLNGVLIVDLIEQMNSVFNFEAYANAPLM